MQTVRTYLQRLSCLLLLALLCCPLCAQTTAPAIPSFTFAFITDLHIGNATSAEDLAATIADLNRQENVDFVIFGGDITEFGSDEEIATTKEMLDGLRKPYYILSGNHDSKWSESGCNTFAKTFGYEWFSFDHNGIRFIGCNSGPNMRMAPALVPREAMVWLDSLVTATPSTQPLIFINHYPMDESTLNYGEVIDILKRGNVQLALCGHGHNDRVLDFDGIPAVMGRSNLRAGKEGPGYNLVTVNGSRIDFRERLAAGKTKPIWFSLRMSQGAAFPSVLTYPRPDYAINAQYPQIQAVWEVQDNSDIGAGAMTSQGIVVFGNTQGVVKALNLQDGQPLWTYTTGGKVFSTPAIAGNRVVIASTDNNVYCLDLKTGKKLWSHAAERSIVASPTIEGGRVFIGGSDGTFRALSLQNGSLLWDYKEIRGFMESKPYADKDGVYAGSWGNRLYAFVPKTGKLLWEWENSGSRMLSPAAVWPVKAQGKLFMVTPERKTYALDAKTGKILWSARGGREAIGLSSDQKMIYIKTMQDTVIAFSTRSAEAQIVWTSHTGYGYEIAPSPITVQDGLLFIPTDKGVIYALKESDGTVVWIHKLSNALVNYILPIGKQELLITTMDGKIVRLQY